MTEFMREEAVCFSGHRNIQRDDLPSLRTALEETIASCASSGSRIFICGGAVGFDAMAAEEVINARMINSEIKLYLALPCHDQTATWNDTVVLRQYKAILSLADEVVYTSKLYETGCYHKRNRWMADHSSVCIAYLIKHSGGTFYTVEYARKIGLNVVNLANRSYNGRINI